MTIKQRREFTAEFKREAVGLLASSGRTIRQIADVAQEWRRHVLKIQADLELFDRRQLATGSADLDFKVFAAAGCAINISAARTCF